MNAKKKYGDKTFADLESGTVEYRGKEYKVWDIEVRPFETVLFADIHLLTEIANNKDEGCPLDDQIAYYADPHEGVVDAINLYLD